MISSIFERDPREKLLLAICSTFHSFLSRGNALRVGEEEMGNRFFLFVFAFILHFY
jgi:hypothetical protein